MTDEQFKSELSQEYLNWTERPGDCDYTWAVEEVQRLCEVIVGLRARIAELEGALSAWQSFDDLLRSRWGRRDCRRPDSDEDDPTGAVFDGASAWPSTGDEEAQGKEPRCQVTRPLPQMKPNSRVEWSHRHGCYVVLLPVEFTSGIAKGKRHDRRDSAEAERRGAMACVEWMFRFGANAGVALREAIERGEVLPAAKPEPWVVSRRGAMGGKPCVRGTRIAVETIQRVARKWSSLKILEEYPGLTPEGLAAALVYRLPGKKARKRT